MCRMPIKKGSQQESKAEITKIAGGFLYCSECRNRAFMLCYFLVHSGIKFRKMFLVTFLEGKLNIGLIAWQISFFSLLFVFLKL